MLLTTLIALKNGRQKYNRLTNYQIFLDIFFKRYSKHFCNRSRSKNFGAAKVLSFRYQTIN
jgi:hypothetical protein